MGWYLPDFFLPKLVLWADGRGLFVEVKSRHLINRETKKAGELYQRTDSLVLSFNQPEIIAPDVFDWDIPEASLFQEKQNIAWLYSGEWDRWNNRWSTEACQIRLCKHCGALGLADGSYFMPAPYDTTGGILAGNNIDLESHTFNCIGSKGNPTLVVNSKLANAYKSARQARFEHNEKSN